MSIQDLTDAVCLALGEKAHYDVELSGRIRSFNAKAEIWHYLLTGRRNIVFCRAYTEVANNESLIKTIVHEIAHFKVVERFRRGYLRNKRTPFGKKNYNDTNALFRARHKRPHTKSFYTLLARMTEKVEVAYGEPLGRLTCSFCKFAGERKK